MSAPRILITGANGFVGQVLCARLAHSGGVVRAAVRTQAQGVDLPCPSIAVGEIDAHTDWNSALEGIEIVIHLAARAHAMNEQAANPLDAYRRVNVAGTERLLRAAVPAGVRRIVFVSSIKVNGETRAAPGFSEADAPQPEDAYGISKLEAEQRLASICAESTIEHVVLRPPLVYGPGVKGNMAALIRAIDRGIPLPLGCIRNQRSLIGIANLVEAIRLCSDHPAAAGKTFLVADERPVSSVELVKTIARALGRTARLLPVPVPLLRLAGSMLGRSPAIARLTSSLVVDSRAIHERLGWRPVSSFEDGIRAMVRGYQAE
jgi:nucleoside-diphosphate-sugar epimerase